MRNITPKGGEPDASPSRPGSALIPFGNDTPVGHDDPGTATGQPDPDSNSGPDQSDPDPPNFAPAERRFRHDGWTPHRQRDFIAALAQTGCVTDAAVAVGMSARSAYALRSVPLATSFRAAWDIALDYAIHRLADAALSRAINGVARPVFFNGEQVGEQRFFDERLTMFLLRTRDPARFGEGLERDQPAVHRDSIGISLGRSLHAVVAAAHDFDPDPPKATPPPPSRSTREK
jgi:hypothetical protein